MNDRLSPISIPIDLLMESAPGCVIIYEGNRDMNILGANENARNFFDCQSREEFEDFCQGSFLQLVADADREAVRTMAMHAKLAGDRKDHLVYYRMQTKAGRIREVEDQGSLMILPDGRELVMCNITPHANAGTNPTRGVQESIYHYNETLRQNKLIESYILQHLDEALEKHYVKVYYQPVTRTINNSLCSTEALARWDDPVYGLMSPAAFIPVLEEHQLITKLDLYVLHEICREMKEREAQGYISLPVSFNLSRQDFIECDIFEEVEKTVAEFDVARDMLYVEITESMVMDDPDIFKREIHRFREAGYQVWMDDFGSGYSSLNVLHEYEFDEIKLDMQFLRRFDERSKRLIRSIITMAKELHIKTLAEGVETKEQYDFLREIGCEKVQGYLFSPPVPASRIIEMYKDQENKVEPRLWHAYYDAVGKINFITDRSLAIVDFDGTNFKYLYVNQAYQEVWKSLGSSDIDAIHENLNSKASPLWKRYRSFQERLSVEDGVQEMEYSIRGKYVRVRCKLICREQGHSLTQVELINLTHNTEEQQRQSVDDTYRMMYAMYDCIYRINMTDRTTEVVVPGDNHHLLRAAEEKRNGSLYEEDMASLVIYRDDQEDYRAFVDPKTVIERIRSNNMGYITGVFRTRVSNGTYVWKLHTILHIPDTDVLIYSSRFVPHLQEQLEHRTHPEPGKISEEASLIWNTLQESKTINLFWKDTNRRFLGVNAKFLETYGFTNAADVIGKTDEEMGWHLDDAPFRDDELRVLKEGKPVLSRVGKGIIKGVVHNILATKEPIYRDGKIVGLVGSFINIDDLTAYLGLAPVSDVIDNQSGLMSAQGVANIIAEYMEGWEFRKENFAVVTLSFGEYKRAEQTYGDRAARLILKEIGQLLSKLCGNNVTAGRTYGGNFVMLVRFEKRTDIDLLQQRIWEECRRIHVIEGYAVTLNPVMQAYFVEEYGNLQDLVSKASGGMYLDLHTRKQLEGRLRENHIQMETVVDALPGGIALFDVDQDAKRLRLTYASEGINTLLGYPTEEYRNIPGGKYFCESPEDEPLVKENVERAIHAGEEFDMSYRAIHYEGNQLWVSAHGRIIGNKGGVPILMCVFQNLSETTQVYDRILNEGIEGVIIREQNTKEILYVNLAATALAVRLFGASLTNLCDELLDGACEGKDREVQLDGRYLQISFLYSKWHGKDVEISYIVDATARYHELLKAEDVLGHVPAAVGVFAVSSTSEVSELYLSDKAKDYLHIDENKPGATGLDAIFDFVHPDDAEYLKREAMQSMTQMTELDTEFRGVGPEGEVYWTRLSTTPFVQPDGSYLIYCVFTDITALKEQAEELEKLSKTDGLTALKNRHALREDFDQLPGKTLTMIMMDIDHFKTFNDTFGHNAGDKVIRVCAEEIGNLFPDSRCYRYGGDEFLVITALLDHEELDRRLREVAGNIRDREIEAGCPPVEISYGYVSGTPMTKEELRAIFKEADAALYERKAEARKREESKARAVMSFLQQM